MTYLYDGLNVDESYPADDPEAMAEHIAWERAAFEDLDDEDNAVWQSYEQEESERRHFYGTDRW